MSKRKMKVMDFFNGARLRIKLIILCIVLVVIGVLVAGFKGLFGNGGRITTISKSSLEKVIEINELSTVDYTYNAVAKALNEDGKVKYYVAYEGIVSAGINFKEIDIVPDEEHKVVTIKIPDVEIHDTRVEMGTLEYIFEKEKYEVETISQEAYKVCIADLESRIQQENTLREMAKENAVTSVEALFEPWIKQIDKEYTVKVE